MTADAKPLALLRRIDQKTAEESLEPWQKPTPLEDTERIPFPDVVYDGFGPIGPFVRELSRFSQTPIDLAGCTILGTLSAAAAGKFEVEVESGYIEPVCLYILTLLQSGSRKSSMFRAANDPIYKWERTQNAEERHALAIWESKNKITKAKVSDLEKSLSKTPKSGIFRSQDDEELQLEAMIRELQDNRPPRVTQIIADDITSERIASKLAEQDGSLAIMSPEGGFFGNIGGRYSDIPGLDTLLKGHSGDPIRTDRQGRPGESVPRPTLTVCISAQPEIATDLGKIPGFRGKGGAARFLVSMPASNLGRRKVEVEPMPPTITTAWHDLITRILDIPIAGRDPEDGYPIPYRIRLDDQARKLHIEFRGDIESDLGEDGFMADMTDWASKLAGAAARIAGLLHIAAYPDPHTRFISVETMQAAIHIANYFAAHAFLFFDALAGEDANKTGVARIVLNEIKTMATTSFRPVTRRDLHQRLRGRSRFKASASLDDPLETLQDHGYIQVVEPHGGGRPSPTIHLNPDF